MSTLNADLLRGLFDTLPPDERSRFVADLTGAAAPQPPPKLLTMEEVASRFGCTVRTVQRWCRDGELQTIKRGRLIRITEDSLYARTTRGGD
ncbi:MAG: helix-turn-helix domain-containing protein [Kiritimatiellaeota bacterium]|nr:helix-turn-helix domain-containing protein [Kiritimatiellota bacterium]